MEYHNCAIILLGQLYTMWNDSQNYGILGHGNQVIHWVPKKVKGPLEGIPISSISYGPWHTTMLTFVLRLFTFVDGKFGVLGHWDNKSATSPLEVLSQKMIMNYKSILWGMSYYYSGRSYGGIF